MPYLATGVFDLSLHFLNPTLDNLYQVSISLYSYDPLFFSFEYFVLKCLGPEIPSSYLLKLTKSDKSNANSANKKEQDMLDEGNKSNASNAESTSGMKTRLELVHVLDLNNNSVQLLNGLAWPILEICENITMSTSGQKVRAKLYFPPELRQDEITKFPMVVHV